MLCCLLIPLTRRARQSFKDPASLETKDWSSAFCCLWRIHPVCGFGLTDYGTCQALELYPGTALFEWQVESGKIYAEGDFSSSALQT